MREIEWEEVKRNLDRLTDEALEDFLRTILDIRAERHPISPVLKPNGECEGCETC